jgi:hypothetical protein
MPSFELHRDGFPAKAATTIQAGQVVGVSAGAVQRTVQPVVANTAEPFGVALATALTGESVSVLESRNVVKVSAAASLGAGADVAVVGATSSLGFTVASGVWRVGVALTGVAAAGEVFSVYVSPRQRIG